MRNALDGPRGWHPNWWAIGTLVFLTVSAGGWFYLLAQVAIYLGIWRR